MATYTRLDGRPVTLGAQLGLPGGEGVVYAVDGALDLAAKIYHQPSVERITKVRAMLANRPEDPTSARGHLTLAWPVDLLTSDTGAAAGFLMPRLNTKTALGFINLYNPKTRQRVAPAFTWEYLLRTARNLSSALAALHERGYVVGDLNESNIFVTNTAQVTLIDCDSLQVPGANGAVYRCAVGREEYTPPELHGVALAAVDRTPVHDVFGLGVLLFQLLLEGQHPFLGVWHGPGSPPELAARIRAGQCPYAPGKAGVITPMPRGLPFATLPPDLQGLFIRCFGDGHTDPSARPSAQVWLRALIDVEGRLQRCAANSQHVYSDHLSACPWHERMRQGLPDPFPPQTSAGAQTPLPGIAFARSGVASGGSSVPPPTRQSSSVPPVAAVPLTPPPPTSAAPTPLPPPVLGSTPSPSSFAVVPSAAPPTITPRPRGLTRHPLAALLVSGAVFAAILLFVVSRRSGDRSSSPAAAADLTRAATAMAFSPPATPGSTPPATAAPTVAPTPTPPPTPPPPPTPAPVSGPTFAVNALPVGCHEAPDAASTVVAQRPAGVVQALDLVIRQTNGETWHREVSQGCWVRTQPGPVQVLNDAARAEDLAVDYRPPPPPRQLTAALTLQTARSRATKPNQGRLNVVMMRPEGPMSDQRIFVLKARTDVRGALVRGDEAANGRTDNTGSVTFDLPSGDYIVAADLPGYNWGTWSEGKGHAGVTVRTGEETTMNTGMGTLAVTIAAVDKAIADQVVYVTMQKRDANGKIVRGDDVGYSRTDNTGRVMFTVAPGEYILQINLPGVNWGAWTEGKGEVNVAVQAGQQTTMDLRPGQLVVAPRNGSGAPAIDEAVYVNLQKRDAAGAPVKGDEVTYSRTDNTGLVRFNLVSGTYVVTVAGKTITNVVVPRGASIRISP